MNYQSRRGNYSIITARSLVGFIPLTADGVRGTFTVVTLRQD